MLWKQTTMSTDLSSCMYKIKYAILSILPSLWNDYLLSQFVLKARL